MDIIIRASRSVVKHKLINKIGKDGCAFWSLRQLPTKIEPGDKVLFSDGETVHAEGKLIDSDKYDRMIEFTPLKAVNYPQPLKPPTRGFAYVKKE